MQTKILQMSNICFGGELRIFYSVLMVTCRHGIIASIFIYSLYHTIRSFEKATESGQRINRRTVNNNQDDYISSIDYLWFLSEF